MNAWILLNVGKIPEPIKINMKKILVLLASFICTCGFAQVKSSVTWDNISAHPAPLPAVGRLIASGSDLCKESWWSVGCETMDREYAHFDKFKDYVSRTGAGYARLQSGWAKTEQKKGRYDFKWLDKHVDGLLEQGVRPWLCLCYGNSLYSEHGTDLDAKLFPDGPVMDAWLSYVKETVKHYKGKISMYEIWNEPDNSSALDSYDLYANLFVRTAGAIRDIDPDVKIAAFGSCSPDLEYIRLATAKIAEMDGLKYMDYITYHAYWPVPENIIPYVKALKEDISAYSGTVHLLQGETGCPGELDYGHAMHSIEWDEYSQAKWDLRSMMVSWGMAIPHSVFTMVDLNYGWMQQSFGLVRTNLKGEPVYLRPKFHAVQHVTSVFAADVIPDESVTAASACGRKIHCTGLSRNGKTIGCVLWLCDRRPGNSLEREKIALRIKGMPMARGKSVYVDMLTGYVHSLPELVRTRGMVHEDGLYFGELPLWDSPILIIDRDEINFK